MSDSPYLTINEAAERAKVSRNTLKAWIRAGLPVLKLSERTCRIKVDVFDAWIDNHYAAVGKSAETNYSHLQKAIDTLNWEVVEKIIGGRS